GHRMSIAPAPSRSLPVGGFPLLMGASRGGGDIAKGSSGGDNAIVGSPSQAPRHTAAAFTPSQSLPLEGEGFCPFFWRCVPTRSSSDRPPRAPRADRRCRRACAVWGGGEAGSAGHWLSQQPLRGGRNIAADRVSGGIGATGLRRRPK